MRFKNIQEIEQSLADQGAPFSTPPSFSTSSPAPDLMSGPVDTDQIPGPLPVATPVDEEPSLIADLALAPVRGVLNATESVADLVTLGNVPEGTINRLGRSKTMAGGFVENASEFLVGFTPGFGWLSKVSKAGKLAKLGKVGQYIAKSNVAKGAIAGAVADFSVFDEHQERLSNLIESVPELQNPITEYLASDEEDSLFEGRMKNALEGLVAGGIIDGLVSGVKALRGAKKAVEAGNIEQANKLLLEAEDPALRALSDEYPEDLAKADAGLIAKANADEDAIASMPGTDGRGNAYMTAEELGVAGAKQTPISEFSPVLTEKKSALPEELKISASKEIRNLNNKIQKGLIQETEISESLQNIVKKLDEKRYARIEKEAFTERVRGADFIEEKLLNAKRKGVLDEQSVDFARWAIQKNPNLVESLGISIRSPKGEDSLSAGSYNPISEIITLFKEQAKEGTIVHEVLHHSERMMPKEIQDGIRKEWAKAYSKAIVEATKSGNTDRVNSLQEMFNSLLDVPGTSDKLKDLFGSGKLKNEDYFLVNPSEFWAENATKILSDRFLAKESWVAQAKQWLKEFYEKIKNIAGFSSKASVLSGLETILKSEGTFVSKQMLSDPRYGFQSLVKKEAEELVPMPEIGPNGKIYDREMKMSEFMGSLPKTQKMVEILNKSDADIATIRQELLGDASRPIVNIFNHSGPAGAHKSVTAFVKVSKAELENYRANNPKQNEVLAEAVEDIKRNGGEKWLTDTLSKVKDSRELPLLVLKMRVAQMDVLSQLGSLSDTYLKALKKMEDNPLDTLAKEEYLSSFIRLNELTPNVTKILFGNKELGTNVGRALAFRKQTKREAKLAEELVARAESWAKDPSKMKQYGTALAEELGQGDAKEGLKLFNQGIERFATLFEKYGERGLVTMAPDKFWIKLHNEWWINALLSGPRTFGVNMIGNTISTLWKPFESAVGAQVAYMKTGNPVFRQIRNSFFSQYGMMFDTAREALVMANKAFKTGESGLVQNKTAVEQFEQIITKENFQAKLAEIEAKHPNSSPLVKGLAKFLVTDNATRAGDLIRLPTKALLWMDEFTKQLNFRSSAKARAISEGYDKGWEAISKGELEFEKLDAFVAQYADETINDLVLKGGGLYSLPAIRREGALEGARSGKTGLDLEDYIEGYVAKNFDETKSNLAKYAYGWAEEVTFTKRGAEGTIQRSVEKFVKDHPSMRLILPFVTTPTNIIKFFGQRAFGVAGFVEGAVKNLDETSPELSKAYLQITKELYSADPFVRAQAEGKLAMGASVLTTAVGLWSAGMITGQGARDEKERALKQATGWQPYSFRIKIPGTDNYQYISYQRFDPLATFFGIVADFADKVFEDDQGSRDWVNFIGSAIGVALSKNITSKSYLTGIEQVMDALNQPDRKMSQFLGTRLGSLVVPSVIGQTLPMSDPIMREARTLMDNVLKRAPGLSERLDPKRNILGEEIKRPEAFGPDYVSPLFISTEKKDKVMDELANLKYSFSLPPVVEKGGIDLYSYKNAQGQSAYDRYLELTGKVTIGRKTLRDALAKLIGTRAYQALPADAVEGLDSPRIAELRRVISKYRSTAKEQVYREFPELDRDSNLRGKLKLARQQGKTLEAQDILRQLNGESL